MTKAPQEIAALLAPMIKKRLWAVISTAKAASAEMEPHAPDHLRYMSDLEARGVLWGSGPFIAPGVVVGDGLTIFNAADEADVHRYMAEEPLTKLGMRSYIARNWELREGMIGVDLLLSESKVLLR
jgi:uncharacterized protein